MLGAFSRESVYLRRTALMFTAVVIVLLCIFLR